MFDRVIPGWEIIRNFPQPLTKGEITLIRFLDENLPKDSNFSNVSELNDYDGWLIFVQPFLNGCRPDIILFHPKVGVQIIEVKDWNLKNYCFAEKEDNEDNGKGRSFYVIDNTGTKHEKTSPVKQVEYYKKKLIGRLVPQIGEKIDDNSKNYGLIKTAIYFHKSITSEAQKLFEHLKIQYKAFPIFGQDELSQEKLSQIVPDSKYSKSYYWRSDWNKEILFWLKPPFHSLEQTHPLTLNSDQLHFSEPKPGHHRVRGVAGSGKTQVLAYRAGNLASQGYRVLILSFNITLWHYIRDMIQRSPFEFAWDKITFNHFHGFCRDILNDFGVPWPNNVNDDETFFQTVVPNKVREVIQRGRYDKYDAILIDEGQDYYLEWYQMLCDFLTDRDELVVVCDKKQNIYGREMEWLDKRRKGVEKFGNWIELKTIIRLPERIAAIAKEFSELFNLNQDVKVGKIERPDLFNQYQEHFVWWNIDEINWLSKVNEAFEIIKSEGTSIHVSDTVILLPNKNYGNVCVKHFEKNKGIGVNHVFESGDEEKHFHVHKRAFWMGDSRLKISSIHSFKGWEVLNVILFIPEQIDGSEELFHRIVYTAITRTRQNLIVINANQNYNEFGKKISAAWI